MVRPSRHFVVCWCVTATWTFVTSQFNVVDANANTPSTVSAEVTPAPPVTSSTSIPQPDIAETIPQSQPITKPVPAPTKESTSAAPGSHPLDPAIQIMEICRDRFAAVFDYEARIVQQERVGKTLMPTQDVNAKFRCHPHSVYFKWNAPEAGREALYVEGRDDGKLLVHAAGIKKAFLGVNRIDPESPQAKRDSRYSVREGGIGFAIDKLLTRWAYERRFDETDVSITSVKINNRPCVLISAVHPRPDDGKFMFHTVRVYIDKEHMLPIRTEAYGYPTKAGKEPGDLLESYTYLELRLNPGLTDTDFSVANPAYEFSRF